MPLIFFLLGKMKLLATIFLPVVNVIGKMKLLATFLLYKFDIHIDVVSNKDKIYFKNYLTCGILCDNIITTRKQHSNNKSEVNYE